MIQKLIMIAVFCLFKKIYLSFFFFFSTFYKNLLYIWAWSYCLTLLVAVITDIIAIIIELFQLAVTISSKAHYFMFLLVDRNNVREPVLEDGDAFCSLLIFQSGEWEIMFF